MAKFRFFSRLFKGIGDIFQHGLNAPFIEEILESSAASNLIKGITGSGLTAAETEQNTWNSLEAQKSRDWTEQMDNTKYQRQTQDLQAAGLNPAMMYGGSVSASGVTGAQASGGDAGSPSAGLLDSILNFLFAKQRMRNLKAEEENIKADSNLKEENANLVESNKHLTDANERLQSLVADYYPKISDKTIEEIDSRIKKALSDIGVNDSTIDLNHARQALTEAQTEIERLNKEWLPKINEASVGEMKAKTVKDYADAAWQKFYKSWTENHAGVTPGRDAWTGFAATMADSISHVVSDVQSYTESIIEGMKEGLKNFKPFSRK